MSDRPSAAGTASRRQRADAGSPDLRIAPYGSWQSPLGASELAAAAVRRSETAVVGEWVYWREERPDDGARAVIVRARLAADGTPPGAPHDIACTAQADIATRVHEYGGAAWCAFADRHDRHWVLGAGRADQRLWLFDANGSAPPRAITPEAPTPGGLRYADGAVLRARGGASQTPSAPHSVWVREDHTAAEAEPVNELVLVCLDGTVSVVASGADFYASPQPSPCGELLAYLSWDHPNMPWDHVRLHVAEIGQFLDTEGLDSAHVRLSDRVLVDGPALQQPRWSPDGVLHVVSDAAGAWEIGRVDLTTGAVSALLAPSDGPVREFGLPAWTFGQVTYQWAAQQTATRAVEAEQHDHEAAQHDNGDAPEPEPVLWCTWMEQGIGRIGRITDGCLDEIHCGFTDFGRLAVTARGTAAVVAGSWAQRPRVVEIGHDAHRQPVSAAEPIPLRPGDVSVPQAVTFDSADGRETHALWYPPANEDHSGPAGELPPLIVLSHGGPTGAARSSLDLGIQFWTSRGIGVVDVNYGGSTGFGTAYRKLLVGQWGVVDSQDCIAAAQWLAARGLADRDRLVVKGGSAGGYTTLRVLTGCDLFAAGLSRYGVADLVSLAADTHKFESRYLDTLIGPWPEAAETYRERSPLTRLDSLTTPMLVLQGSDDRVVPPSQSEQLAAALQRAGVRYAYVCFEGEAHGFRKPDSVIAATWAELSFAAQILGFVPADDIERIDIVG